ncbi:uncharacterized protein LOC129334794 [Eublepharis macularius]|uniref:Uncharacterized protein LOC129334794 n=1 Tax=Eublepharis macularius TaxID=481883 RepID=A0AA97L5I7_EUBMA|nr:uncharacterized protein LOC129334794 [Eublepharis macularius]
MGTPRRTGYIPIFTLTGFNGTQMAEKWQNLNSTLLTPSGREFIINGTCQQTMWKLDTTEIGEWGPPQWDVQLDGSQCNRQQPFITFRYQCHRQFSSVPAEAGIYRLQQPGKVLQFEVLAGENDLLKPRKHPLIGPHVVKKDHKMRAMLTPVRSLKEIRLDLTGLNISQAVPECAPYVTTSHEGWKNWIDLWYTAQLAKTRFARGLDTILGASGLAAGALDAMDIEVLANKISYTTADIKKMGTPIASSLVKLGIGQKMIASILPFWQQVEQKDEEAVVQGLASLQISSALALACTQAQDLAQMVVMQIIREGLLGNLPIEIRSLLWNNVTQGERDLVDWWKLVNFTYDPLQSKVKAFVLTVYQTDYYDVYPIVPLGLQMAEGLVMYATDHHSWAYMKQGKWETLNMEGCVYYDNLGFICEDYNFQQRDECFHENLNGSQRCTFEIMSEWGSSVVYVGSGCICVRTHCPLIHVDEFQLFYVSPQISRCYCHVTQIRGCNFHYHVPQWTAQLMQQHPHLYTNIQPVTLGMDLEVLRKLVQHPELQKHLQTVKQTGDSIAMEVQHDGSRILKVAERIATIGGESLWSSIFFDVLSPTAASFLRFVTHPIIVLLLCQIFLFLFLLVIVIWIKHKLKQLQGF